jgi:hypothetical protein
METTLKKRAAGVATAAALAFGISGLLGASLAVSWIAGSLGISAAAASQIMTAIEVGGWALVVIGTVFGAGITGGLIATARWFALRWGRAQAVA